MESVKELTCIGCPLGCPIRVTLKDGEIAGITGFTCNTGKLYAQKECTNPSRIFTSSVPVVCGELGVVSLKSENDIPKDKIFECARLLKDVKVAAPVKIGDIIVKDIAGTGVNLVATRDVERKEDL